jgi:hypothetical protein
MSGFRKSHVQNPVTVRTETGIPLRFGSEREQFGGVVFVQRLLEDIPASIAL